MKKILRFMSSESKKTPLVKSSKTFDGLNNLYQDLSAVVRDSSKLHQAVINDDLSKTQSLVIKVPQSQDKQLRSPLHLACALEHVQIARVLLEYNANPNLRDAKGWTPIMLACYNGNASLVHLLIAYRADVSFQNSHGSTAVLLATQKDHAPLLPLLVREGADLDVYDKAGFAPIHYAVNNNSLRCTSFLIDEGTDVNAHSKAAPIDTPLILACKRGYAELVDFLIACGADLDYRNGQGESAYLAAIANGHVTCAELVKEAVSVANSPASNANSPRSSSPRKRTKQRFKVNEREIAGQPDASSDSTDSLIRSDRSPSKSRRPVFDQTSPGDMNVERSKADEAHWSVKLSDGEQWTVDNVAAPLHYTESASSGEICYAAVKTKPAKVYEDIEDHNNNAPADTADEENSWMTSTGDLVCSPRRDAASTAPEEREAEASKSSVWDSSESLEPDYDSVSANMNRLRDSQTIDRQGDGQEDSDHGSNIPPLDKDTAPITMKSAVQWDSEEEEEEEDGEEEEEETDKETGNYYEPSPGEPCAASLAAAVQVEQITEENIYHSVAQNVYDDAPNFQDLEYPPTPILGNKDVIEQEAPNAYEPEAAATSDDDGNNNDMRQSTESLNPLEEEDEGEEGEEDLRRQQSLNEFQKGRIEIHDASNSYGGNHVTHLAPVDSFLHFVVGQERVEAQAKATTDASSSEQPAQPKQPEMVEANSSLLDKNAAKLEEATQLRLLKSLELLESEQEARLSLERHCESLQHEVAQLNEKNRHLIDAMDNLSATEIVDLTQAQKESQMQMDYATQSIEALKMELQEKERDFQAEMHKKEQLESEHASLEREFNQLQLTHARCHADRLKQTADLTEMQKTMRQSEEDSRLVEERISILTGEKEEVERKLSAQKSQLNAVDRERKIYRDWATFFYKKLRKLVQTNSAIHKQLGDIFLREKADSPSLTVEMRNFLDELLSLMRCNNEAMLLSLQEAHAAGVRGDPADVSTLQSTAEVFARDELTSESVTVDQLLTLQRDLCEARQDLAKSNAALEAEKARSQTERTKLMDRVAALSKQLDVGEPVPARPAGDTKRSSLTNLNGGAKSASRESLSCQNSPRVDDYRKENDFKSELQSRIRGLRRRQVSTEAEATSKLYNELDRSIHRHLNFKHPPISMTGTNQISYNLHAPLYTPPTTYHNLSRLTQSQPISRLNLMEPAAGMTSSHYLQYLRDRYLIT